MFLFSFVSSHFDSTIWSIECIHYGSLNSFSLLPDMLESLHNSLSGRSVDVPSPYDIPFSFSSLTMNDNDVDYVSGWHVYKVPSIHSFTRSHITYISPIGGGSAGPGKRNWLLFCGGNSVKMYSKPQGTSAQNTFLRSSLRELFRKLRGHCQLEDDSSPVSDIDSPFPSIDLTRPLWLGVTRCD